MVGLFVATVVTLDTTSDDVGTVGVATTSGAVVNELVATVTEKRKFTIVSKIKNFDTNCPG